VVIQQPVAEVIISDDGWAAYSGPHADHRSHAHVAVQLFVARSGSAVVGLAQSQVLTGRFIIVGPGVRHRMLDAGNPVLMMYLETHSPLATRLMDAISPNTAAVAPRRIADLVSSDDPPDRVFARLNDGLTIAAANLDLRLDRALKIAATDPNPGAIARAADAVGLSAPRLRALAKAQMQTPLSQWLLWRKLRRACAAMETGGSLVDAALAGGFADQAHMSRTMRRMFGVTPAQASGAVRRTGKRNVQ
jgi:AraC-like DNA-binding protein